ncbi:hypothetical protein GYMLUDRAFT_165592 [Collybiopsis luxurians FD-317 M1]|uniref:Uncharacterized protein n=1 Tax=Collybiopsis luxurians FD-317 M1 TaxID=944289 RepID=A0A0D0BDR9_9AGAR|nr:hypothetical protein GYMLUDRAFT_165592 [Collybiopsis luxurians FD-317 M1]
MNSIQVSALNGRSEAGHSLLAWEMLHNAVVGPADVEKSVHFQAFIKGLRLPSLNYCIQVSSSFSGGVEAFIDTALSSEITSFGDLNISFRSNLSDEEEEAFDDAMAEAGQPFAGNTFSGFIQDFLANVGAPCPQLLGSIQGSFSPEARAALSAIQSPTFRMRMLCWAVTGATQVLQEGEPIKIYLVSDRDPSYVPQGLAEEQHCAYINSGADYDPNSEPQDVKSAVHHWLLVQILESIGSYTLA